MKPAHRNLQTRLRLPIVAFSIFSFWSLNVAFAAAPTAKPNPGIPANWRNIASGWTIPDEDYADQPYIVKADDGAWVCVITTADGHEGATSQHVVATRSTDFGRTWSPLIAIEPSGPPESSCVTLLKTPAGQPRSR